MSKSINIVFIKQWGTDKDGTIFIRTIENRIIKKKSLNIKVKHKEWKTFFNPKTKRFKEDKRFPLYELINQRIDEQLKELSKYGNDLNSIPDERKSFLLFWKESLKNFDNHGTVIKHATIINKLEKYLRSISKNDLLFKDITPTFLRGLKKYWGSAKDPKILTENSVNHYLKVFKSIINQAIRDEYYAYPKHPFSIFKFTNEKKSKKVLTEKEVEKLLATKVEEAKLNQIRDMFLFQIFSNGMRISDLFLLRWNNFINERLKYSMFKTGTEIDIPVNINIGMIVSKRMKNPIDFNDISKTSTISFIDETRKTHEINLTKLDKVIEKLKYPKYTYNPLVNRLLIDMDNKVKENMNGMVAYKGHLIDKENAQLKMLIDVRENLVNKIQTFFLTQFFIRVNEIKQEGNGNDFVFPFLSNKLFNDINQKNDFTKISLEQYKSIKHQTIMYNRWLKRVQKICEIETPLSSHVSRHTFTNFLLRMENVNLYDISQSLGHSSIKITENYLRSGFNIEKIDYLNKGISSKYLVK